MIYQAKNDTVTVRGGDMDYIRFGTGERILIMIPGLGDGLRTVKGTAKPMAAMYREFTRDFTVYAFSRVNNLPAGHTTRDMARDLAQAMEQLGIEKADILGVSMGGMIAQHLAIDHPRKVDKLVLFYPALCIPDDARAGKMLVAKFDPENPPEIINCGPMKLGKCYPNDVVRMDPYAEISPYQGPVLIIHGTKDRIVNVDYAHKAAAAYEASVPGRTQLCIIDDGAHGFSKKHDVIAIDRLKAFAK